MASKQTKPIVDGAQSKPESESVMCKHENLYNARIEYKRDPFYTPYSNLGIIYPPGSSIYLPYKIEEGVCMNCSCVVSKRTELTGDARTLFYLYQEALAQTKKGWFR